GRRLPRELRLTGEDRRAHLQRDDRAAQLGLGPRGRRRDAAPGLRVPGGAAREASAMSYLPYALAGWLFVVGLYGVVTSRNLIHLVMCLSVAQSGTYVLLLAIGYVKGGTAPIVNGVALGTRMVDPVVQALTLTDVVVSVTTLA